MVTLATTGTYSFAPSVGECVLNALSRLQIRGPAVMAEHMQQALIEANLMQAEWSNRGPNLWDVDLQTVSMIPGQASYAVPPETVMILDVTVGLGTAPDETEIRITPLSRSEYMSYPNKDTPGRPTSYWFDRLIAPTITLWPVPDQDYSLNYYRYRQIQDAATASATNFEIPFLWLDAACAGLAHRLARHYAPQLEQQRKMDAVEAWGYAATQNVEDAPLYITPMIGAYYP
jgi:hypothetical protein